MSEEKNNLIKLKFSDKENEINPITDQYTCPFNRECRGVPIFKDISLSVGTLFAECLKCNDKNEFHFKDFLNKMESNDFYYFNRIKCQKGGESPRGDEYKFCLCCNKVMCKKCIKDDIDENNHSNKHVKINKIQLYCDTHRSENTRYCKGCQKNFCEACMRNDKIGKNHESRCPNGDVVYLRKYKLKEDEINQLNEFIESLKRKIIDFKEHLEQLENTLRLYETIRNTVLSHEGNGIFIDNAKKFLEKLHEMTETGFFGSSNNLSDEDVNKFNEFCKKYKFDENIDNIYNIKFQKKTLGDEGKKELEEINFSFTENLALKEMDINNYDFLLNKNLESLKSLVLEFNKIESLIGMEKLKMRILEVLSLQGNHIKNINGIENANFPYLRILELAQNEIVSISPLKNFKYAKSITKLNLYKNKLGKLDDLVECELSSLEYLNIADNEIKDLSPLKQKFPALIRLRAGNNPISNLEPLNYGAFRKLEQLELCYCEIENIKPLNNAPFTSLTTLLIDHNQIKEQGIKFKTFNLHLYDIRGNTLENKEKDSKINHDDFENHRKKGKIVYMFDPIK